MSAARQVLERLLHRGERAHLRDDGEPASLSMSGRRDAPEYLALRSLGELDAFHAEIALAERAGAIHAKRDGKTGDGSRLERLQIIDLQLLARHLGKSLVHEQAEEAAALLADWLPRHPVLDQVIEAWRQGRKVRGHDAMAAAELAMAAQVIAERERDPGSERILRKESARLFDDSKRIEKLTPWLEILVAGELGATGLSKEDVWSAIGLRHEPQPMLISGRGVVELDDGPLRMVRPYLGLPVESVRGVSARIGYLLTIENLTSFHEAARANTDDGLLIYTGGMPSPAWCSAYVRIMKSLPEQVAIYHWGDIDEGGFRIAEVLGRQVGAAGRELRPWLMSPSSLPDAVVSAAAIPDDATFAAMCLWAGRAGWAEVAQALREHPMVLEQEKLPPAFPVDTRAA